MFYRWQGDSLRLECHLQPGARGDGFAGSHGERLKVRISAPPVDGKANAHLIGFLAGAFGVPRQQVCIERGLSARQKTVVIEAPKVLPAELGIEPPPLSK